MIGGQYATLCVERKKDEINLIYIESDGDGDRRNETVIERLSCIDTMEVYLKVQFNKEQTCVFFFSTDGVRWSQIKRKFSPKGAHWVGAKVGIFAITDGSKEKEGYADFSYLKVTAIDEK